jgi:outer membrane protein assembly factor BamA
MILKKLCSADRATQKFKITPKVQKTDKYTIKQVTIPSNQRTNIEQDKIIP